MTNNILQTDRSGRVVGLDLLRGLAIVGTLAANAWVFARGLGSDSFAVDALTGQEYATRLPDQVRYFLTDGKSLALLTLLFGVGIEIQRQRARATGHRWPGGYILRCALLFLDGLVNYLLVFKYDILMGYALAAVAVAGLLATSLGGLWVRATIALVVHGAHLVAVVALAYLSPFRLSDADTSDWFDMVRTRTVGFVAGRWEIPIVVTMAIACFMVGAALYRSGVFAADGRVIRSRIALAIGPLAVVLDAASQFHLAPIPETFARYFTSIGIAVALLCLVVEWRSRQHRSSVLTRALENIGRMALTCYIGQNVAMSVLFYGFGLHLQTWFPEPWRPVAIVMVVAVLTLGMASASAAWLARHRRGPIESINHRLLASLSRRKKPMSAMD